MSKIEDVVLAMGEQVKKQGDAINTLLEMVESLQRNLTTAFKETGFDFAKLAAVESSRRQKTIQESTDVIMEVEEADPEVRNEIAERILKNQPSKDGEVNV
jgi:CRISPR/Cas system endoribonuclease Cas6 (RAMP superfamily)